MPRTPRRAAVQRRRRSRRPAGRRMVRSAPTTMHGRLRADDARPAPRPRRRTAGLSMPSSVLREVVVGPARHRPWWDYHRVDRRLVIPAIYLLQSPRVLHQELVHGLARPGRWCRPSICSIWWNARFNDFSHTLGFRSSKTPPQTRQPVLGDGQGVGAYSKSKLLRLVRYTAT